MKNTTEDFVIVPPESVNSDYVIKKIKEGVTTFEKRLELLLSDEHTKDLAWFPSGHGDCVPFIAYISQNKKHDYRSMTTFLELFKEKIVNDNTTTIRALFFRSGEFVPSQKNKMVISCGCISKRLLKRLRYGFNWCQIKDFE